MDEYMEGKANRQSLCKIGSDIHACYVLQS